MIVPSMTSEELYHELVRDYDIIGRRGLGLSRLYQKEMVRKKLQKEVRWLVHKTPFLNEWKIIIKMTPRDIKTAFYVKAADKKGKVAYSIQFYNFGAPDEHKKIIKYNSHFFQRYNERMNLGITDTSKLIDHFFKYNFDSDFGQSELLPNGIRCVQFILPEGMGIGWQDDEKKFINVKTFVSDDMYTKNQRSLADYIKYGGDDDQFQYIVKIENINKAFK